MSRTTKIVLGVVAALVVLALIISACGLVGLVAYRSGTNNVPAPTQEIAKANSTESPTVKVPPTPIPTVVPPTPTVAPTQPPAAPNIAPSASLNYDESNSDALVSGQTELLAICLRNAEADFNVTQAEMETCVSLHQQMAASANATIYQGSTLTLDSYQAWYVWCSDATSVNPPTDVSMVFDTLPSGPGRIWIQLQFLSGVPARSDDTWTGCNGSFWAVAVH